MKDLGFDAFLPVFAWISSRCSCFLQEPKDMHNRSNNDSNEPLLVYLRERGNPHHGEQQASALLVPVLNLDKWGQLCQEGCVA